MIRIAAKQEGFRRCGIAHTVMETEYPEDRFTEEEMALLKAEPMLVVHVVDRPGQALTATAMIALVKEITDREALEVLATGEERKSVLAAIAARRQELTPEAAE